MPFGIVSLIYKSQLHQKEEPVLTGLFVYSRKNVCCGRSFGSDKFCRELGPTCIRDEVTHRLAVDWHTTSVKDGHVALIFDVVVCLLSHGHDEGDTSDSSVADDFEIDAHIIA